MSRSPRTPMRSPAFPDIPIYLDTGDERITAKTYGTTPTTPTTPDIIPPQRPTHLSPSHINAPPISPAEPSPTTTIETSSCRSVIWPIPEPPPEIQHQSDSRRPTLRFFPTERPRVRLDTVHSLQVPSINEKTPISYYHPGLGIVNGPPKPPSIEISPPINEKSDPSANFAQRIEETLWRYSASGNVYKRWLLELLSWLFSAFCMAAVVGVLIGLQDKPLAKWVLAEKTGLTLNTYISILSKMAGAALILPVSEALGQLKWSWFLEHSKQMWDFEIFDNASRGPWGSLLLLIRTKGKALAALGAMIMLCSLALDPFFQQVVDFPDRWALQNTTSAIPRAPMYMPPYVPDFFHGEEQGQEDRDFTPVIKKFLYGNGTQPIPFLNGTKPEIPLSCPTSNCTWPEYETLAVCSSCAEVSHLLDIKFDCLVDTTVDWTATWQGPLDEVPYPNGTVCGYFLNITSAAPILLSGYVAHADESQNVTNEALIARTIPLSDFDTKEPLYGVGSVKYKDIRNPILDALIASAIDGPASVFRNDTPVVHECILSWCVQSIKSAYDWGKYTENVTATYLNTPDEPFSWPWEVYEAETGQDLIYTQNITLKPPPSRLHRLNTTAYDNTYRVDNITAYKTMGVFDDFFPSYYTLEDGSSEALLSTDIRRESMASFQ
ncbi:uncharacterized protein J4E78_006736 [Alternaria triticimaculans]|uniref:uncharacterized protein n=1 Tax=Alternaria triticimaculans TaxID=297637 RepID=UPI0020C58C02|nr:uncharacterized protein J4E78_006736 [Alternaria triticimaculans]KAI4656845.1 hypothetical protein J4E78_006736 [Alternaria triticimaculans]